MYRRVLGNSHSGHHDVHGRWAIVTQSSPSLSILIAKGLNEVALQMNLQTAQHLYLSGRANSLNCLNQIKIVRRKVGLTNSKQIADICLTPCRNEFDGCMPLSDA